jgi:putative MATE family efflux protein
MSNNQSLDISTKGLLKVAIPISLGGFVQFIVVLTDNAFLSRVGMNVMNGAGLGSMLFITLIMLGIGLASGAQIIIARRNGSALYEQIGQVFSNTLLLSILLGFFLLGLMLCTMAPLFNFLVDSDEVRGYMSSYMSIRFFGLAVYMPSLVITSLYMGIAKTRILIYSTLITAGVNLGLDWMLIFGEWGAPKLGIRGAAIATVVAEILNLIFLIVYLRRDNIWKKFSIWKYLRTLSFSESGRILNLSGPIMGQQVVALATWTVFFMFIEKLGEKELMSSQIVRFMYMMVFVTMMGVSQTTKTYVSGLIAEKRQDQLNKVLLKLVLLNLLGIAILSHGMLLYPRFITTIFSQDVDVIFLTEKSMFTVIFAFVLACFSSVFLNAVEGCGKTKIAMVIEIGASVSYVVLTYYVTVVSPKPIYLVWMNDYMYFGSIAIVSLLVLRFSNWKYVNV